MIAIFFTFYPSKPSPFHLIFHLSVCCKHVQLDTIDQTVIELDLLYPNTWEKKMVDTYTKRPIYELTGKNNKRYFLYWVKTEYIKTIEYPRSRAGNKDGWIVRKLFCFILLNLAECISICIPIHLIVIIEFILPII